jgi:hypothetical protein
MLSAVAIAGMFFADLTRPLTPEEYAQVITHEVLLHEPLSPEVRSYYLAKGRVLAGFLREGMTNVEVRQVLGVRPSGWVFEGARWSSCYAPLGVTVRYRVAEAEVAGRERLELLVQEVETTPPWTEAPD